MNNLIRNKDCCFDDLFLLNIPDFIIDDPFNCYISKIDPSIQEDIIDIQNDSEFKILFKNKRYTKCWLNINEKYENIWKLIKLLLLAFPTSYLFEKGYYYIIIIYYNIFIFTFSSVIHILTKYRNNFDIVGNGSDNSNILIIAV